MTINIQKMHSIWYGCETCRRSFLKLNDLFQHKEVHPLDLEKKGIQSIKQTISFRQSGDLSALGSIRNFSQVQTQHNPFVLARRLTSQEILQNSSVSTKVSRAKYTEQAISTTLPTAKRSPNNVAVFHCKLCLFKFNSDSKLTLHLNTCAQSHQHRDRFCVPCNTKFHNKHNLKRHISTRHKEKKAKTKQCEYCPMKFVYESQLNHHLLTHTKKKEQTQKGSTIKFGQQKFQCHQPDCGKTFHLKHHYTNHLATHSDARPFTCPEPNCLSAFKTKDVLHKHIKNVHRASQPSRHLFKQCGSSFKEKLPLRQHPLTHSNRGQFKCPKTSCSRTFNRSDSLWYHTKTHSGLRPFKCPEAGCKKSFKFESLCRQHQISHSDARPFACSHQNCEKAYKSRDKLKRHLKSSSHSDSPSSIKSTKLQPKKSTFEIKTKPQATQYVVNLNARSFICKQSKCGKWFATSSSLYRHQRSVHSEEKPFKCPVSTCEFKCKVRFNLQRHILTHLKCT